MQKEILVVDGVFKKYRLGKINSKTFRADLYNWSRSILHLNVDKDDREAGQSPEYFTALSDVSFSLDKGDSLALIGGNGAGKSTLLKLISRVTMPTKGNIYYNGKLTSLLEVGTGFHPELSGRENIYLNGAILGMRRSEIAQKLDSIVEFSGVQKFLDTAVKRYSSGMYVRLAFSVAAFLDTDILILDEVLAVGDVEFQKRCVERVSEMIKQDGRTVIFVGHNQNVAANFCNKALFLNEGRVKSFGDYSVISEEYAALNSPDTHLKIYKGVGPIVVQEFFVEDNLNQSDDGVSLILAIRTQEFMEELNVRLEFYLYPNILLTKLNHLCEHLSSGDYMVKFIVPEDLICSPNVHIKFSLFTDSLTCIYRSEGSIRLKSKINAGFDSGIFKIENCNSSLQQKS
jgi:lipopolysaccharide transport system ATP-binding protein